MASLISRRSDSRLKKEEVNSVNKKYAEGLRIKFLRPLTLTNQEYDTISRLSYGGIKITPLHDDILIPWWPKFSIEGDSLVIKGWVAKGRGNPPEVTIRIPWQVAHIYYKIEVFPQSSRDYEEIFDILYNKGYSFYD